MGRPCERCESLPPSALGLMSGVLAFMLMASGWGMAKYAGGSGGSMQMHEGGIAEVLKRIDDLKARQDAMASGIPGKMTAGSSALFRGGSSAGKLMNAAVLEEFEAKAEFAYWYQASERDPEQHLGKFEKFMPNWPCMWGEALIGKGLGDGTKWMCGAHVMKEPCVVYSFGSQGNFKFEEGIKDLGLDCDIHVYDPTWGKPGVTQGPGWTYHKVGLANEESRKDPSRPYKTLQTLMKENGHTYIDVLKVDIEGSEKAVVGQLSTDGWPSVGQFLVEAHHEVFRSAEHLGAWIHGIEHANLRLFHLELNLHQSCCMEYAFIHKDWRPETKNYNMTTTKRLP